MFGLTLFGVSPTFLLGQLRSINAHLFGFGIEANRGRFQSARATNQNIIVGNYGAVRTGVQSANAVNA